jgi:hypothetical protein
MAVLSQNAGLPHHADSSQFYNAMKNYDVHNILRQHCKMQGDREGDAWLGRVGSEFSQKQW